jgi:hypothetical protein
MLRKELDGKKPLFSNQKADTCLQTFPRLHKTLVSFGSQNTPLKWNDYSIGRVIALFDRNLFFGRVILVFLRRRISIPLRNERNNYS